MEWRAAYGIIELLGHEEVVNSDNKLTCHVCGSTDLKLFPQYGSLVRVSSDCFPYRSGGKLGTCSHCGCTVNPTDAQWHAEVDEIYDKYAIYHQSTAYAEQVVFNNRIPAPRSQRILEKTGSYVDFQKPGKLLDFGCSNGSLLKAFSRLAPSWTMSGYEWGDKYREQVLSIEGVVQFESRDFQQIGERFSLITVQHVLEHLDNPLYWLAQFRERLLPGGFLLVQVPDTVQYPFDLIVADHCTHFTMPTLSRMIEHAGYELVVATNDWLDRELSVLARPKQTAPAEPPLRQLSHDGYSALRAITWFEELAKHVREAARNKPFAIFGSSIAATWLYAVLDGDIDFFIDEDINRIGQRHLGKLIVGLDDVSNGTHVFIGLTASPGNHVKERLSDMPFHVYAPAAFEVSDVQIQTI